MSHAESKAAAPTGLLCPSCGAAVAGVKWVRRRKGGIVRKRECPCGRGFTTRETVVGASRYTGVTELHELERITPTVQPPLVLLEHGSHPLRKS